jgi:hypothetical protein
MQALYIVVEELWSISSKPNERRRLSTSERPLFSGGTKRLAYAHARELASKFRFYGVHDEDDQIYWWGRNEEDHANRRFVIEPAQPSCHCRYSSTMTSAPAGGCHGSRCPSRLPPMRETAQRDSTCRIQPPPSRSAYQGRTRRHVQAPES